MTFTMLAYTGEQIWRKNMARLIIRKTERATGEKRRAVRVKTNAPAIVQTTSSQGTVMIVDISATGARLIALGAPPCRQDVKIYVNGLWLFGRIAWRRGKAFGVTFEHGLHEHSAAEILAAVEESSEQNVEFDRESVLVSLMNKYACENHITPLETVA